MNKNSHKTISICLAFAAVYLIWGSTYLAIRIAVATMPPFLLSGLRFLTAGSILYIAARTLGAPRPRLKEWSAALFIGLSLTVMGNGFVVFAEKRLPSSIAALFIPVVPLWLLIFDWLWGAKIRPTWRAWCSVAMGFAGVGLLVADSFSLKGYNIRALDISAMLVATMAWAAGSIFSRYAKLPSSTLLVTGMQMLCGTVILFTLSFISGEKIQPELWSEDSYYALAYLIIFGSLVAFTAYTFLLRNVHPSLVGTYAFVNPVIAMLLGSFLYGEPVSHTILLSALLIIGAVVGLFIEGQRQKRNIIKSIPLPEFGMIGGPKKKAA
jgi:drug/metabolite transporter (DMT)-like permease